MPNWFTVDFESIGVGIGSALGTLFTVLGLQKKASNKVATAHGTDRTEIRKLQDRCKDLEHDVANLTEKITAQAERMMEAERRHADVTRLMFNKLDTMNETLIEIRVAVGIQEKR